MLTKKSLFVPAALMFLIFASVPAKSAPPQCYTLESLEGSYAGIGHYGANEQSHSQRGILTETAI